MRMAFAGFVAVALVVLAAPARGETVGTVGFAGGAFRLGGDDLGVGGMGAGGGLGIRRGRTHVVGEYAFLVAFGDPEGEHGSGALHRLGLGLRWRAAEIVVDGGEIAFWIEGGAGRLYPRVDGLSTDAHADLQLGFGMEIRPNGRDRKRWSFLFGARTVFTELFAAPSETPRVMCAGTVPCGDGAGSGGSGGYGAGIVMFLGSAWGR